MNSPFRHSSQDELTRLFEDNQSSLLGYLRSFGLAPHDCEEVLQEVFLALHRHLDQGRDTGQIRGWLFRVAHNHAADWLARPTPAPLPDDSTIACAALNPEQQLLLRQREQRVQRIIRALPAIDRSILALRAEGFRMREISEILSLSLGSVSQSVARSLARIHEATR